MLHAQLVGTIAAPITGLVRGLNALIAGLAIQLQAIVDLDPPALVSGEAPPAREDEPTAAATPDTVEAPDVQDLPEPEPAAEPEATAEPEAAAEPEAETPTDPIVDVEAEPGAS